MNEPQAHTLLGPATQHPVGKRLSKPAVLACAGRLSLYEGVRAGGLRPVKRGRRKLILVSRLHGLALSLYVDVTRRPGPHTPELIRNLQPVATGGRAEVT